MTATARLRLERQGRNNSEADKEGESIRDGELLSRNVWKRSQLTRTNFNCGQVLEKREKREKQQFDTIA